MARSFDQIYSELSSVYDPSVQIAQKQLELIPGQTEAAIAASDAKLKQANEGILTGARQRGLGFSGIPLAEQAQYAAGTYAPAVLSARNEGEQRRLGLVESINSINRDRRTHAQGVFDQELARDFQERQFQEQVRQFNEQQAAQERARQAASAPTSAGIGAYLNASGGQAAKPAASYGFRNGKDGSGGFYFVDSSGKAISAAKYASMTGANMVQLIQKMAAQGDRGANAVLRGPGVEQNNTYKKQFAWDM